MYNLQMKKKLNSRFLKKKLLADPTPQAAEFRFLSPYTQMMLPTEKIQQRDFRIDPLLKVNQWGKNSRGLSDCSSAVIFFLFCLKLEQASGLTKRKEDVQRNEVKGGLSPISS